MTRKIFFFENYAENEAGTLVPDLFIFQKSLYEVKESGLQLIFNVSIALNLAYNKNKLSKTLLYWSRENLNFNFSEKGLALVFPSHFVYDFSRKMFLKLFSLNWPFHCLIAFTSRNIGQHVYYDCLLIRLWRHEIWI